MQPPEKTKPNIWPVLIFVAGLGFWGYIIHMLISI